MARGKRNLTLLERIELTEAEIKTKEEELKDLKAKKKSLLDQKKREDMEEIYQIVVQSGKSVDEVRKLISGEA